MDKYRPSHPDALQSDSFLLPEWMEHGFQYLRVPDHYWKYFPERFVNRFAFADYLERYPLGEHVLMHGAPVMRRYLIEQGVIASNARFRKSPKGKHSDAYLAASRYFGGDFVERFLEGRIPRTKQHWANLTRSQRSPHEFAQSEALGNIWPEALIAQVQLDFSILIPAFEEHRTTPEERATEHYQNALSDAKFFGEQLDLFIRFIRNNVQRRTVRPMLIVRRWVHAPKQESGLGYEAKPYDHSISKRALFHLGERIWTFLEGTYDKTSRKHTTMTRDELIKRLNDERPVPPELPDHLKQSPEAPVIFDEDGTIIPVRFDAGRDCWVDDFGDPVSVEKNDE